VFVVLAIIALTTAGIWGYLGPPAVDMRAERIVPAHTAPGQAFPVLVKIEVGRVPASFILQENIPQNCRLISPSAGGVYDPKSRELKWLTKAKNSPVVFGYMLRPDPAMKPGSEIELAGRLTQRRSRGRAHEILGGSRVALSLYHWADSDENGVIDDEEILAVYDDFNEVSGISLDMDLIEEIWFGSGYRWDQQKDRFVVIP